MGKILTAEKFQSQLNQKFNGDIELLEYINRKSPACVKCRKCGFVFQQYPQIIMNVPQPCYRCRKDGGTYLNEIAFDFLLWQEGFCVTDTFENGSHQCRIKCARCDSETTWWYLPSNILKDDKKLPECPNCKHINTVVCE